MAKKINTQAAAGVTQFNMTTEVELAAVGVSNEESILESLLDQLGDDEILETAGDEIAVEVVEPADIIASGSEDATAAIGDDLVGDLLDEIASDAEREGAKQEMYATQSDTSVADGTAPETDASALTDEGTGKKKGKGKAKKAAADPDAPAKEPKPPRATSVTHSPGALLKVKLGEKAKDYLTFSMADATLDADALDAKQAAFIDRMNDSEAIADKVKEKMTMFLVWLTKGGDLNEVMRRALTVLHADGELTSGDKGNLQLNLLAKPYSVGTARSQANQCFMFFPELGLAIKEKGRMVPNPDSALLPMAYTMLRLA
ncbi:MAG: hypothetical protein WKG03_03690 [Telluria sp.]